MKLLNRTITCGGKFGCGHVFEFGENSTVEFAAKIFREHRAEPGHMQRVLDETNTRRLLSGEYALTMDELVAEAANL